MTVMKDCVGARNMIGGLVILLLAGGLCFGDSTRILPLGNSITEGTTDTTSYRRPLWHMLDSAGYPVDFIGTLGGVEGIESPLQDYDLDHEGRWGWTVEQILDSLPVWLQSYTPDIVLLHIGTNNAGFDEPLLVGLYIQAIIETLQADNPEVIVLLAQLIPYSFSTEEIDALNEQITVVRDSTDTEQAPVILVDQNTGFDVETETVDGCHPNRAGAERMARKWFEHLDSLLVGTVSSARIAGYAPRPDCRGGSGSPGSVFSNEAVVRPDGRVITVVRPVEAGVSAGICYGYRSGAWTKRLRGGTSGSWR